MQTMKMPIYKVQIMRDLIMICKPTLPFAILSGKRFYIFFDQFQTIQTMESYINSY